MRWKLLIAGLVSLAAVWLGPLPTLAGKYFWAHMTLHMGVVAVAAPLCVLGVAGSTLDPVHKAPRFFSPIVLSVVELLIVWLWHAPALHYFARHTAIGFTVEQSTFFVSAALVWLSAFGGNKEDVARRAAGVVALLLTFMHMTLLGALLALATRPLYGHVSSMADQHWGGAIMLLGGGISYLIGGLWLTVSLVRRPSGQLR